MVAVHESRAWPKNREPDSLTSPWPAGTTVVSADSHFLEPEDRSDYLPAKHHGHGPKGHWDETGYHMEADGRSLDNRGFPSEMIEGRPGMWDVNL